MHVRCDNQYKTGADRENILGQPMLFVCMGICVLSSAHENQMRGYLVYVQIVKNLLILFKFSHSILDWTVLSWNIWGIFSNIFRGVCRPYHLQRLYSESALFYLLQSGHIPDALLKIVREDKATVLIAICQKICETKEWPKEWTQCLTFLHQRKAT